MSRVPDEFSAAVRRFADELHTIYRNSGFRTVQSLANGVSTSRSSLTAYLNADRLPPEKQFIGRFVEACIDDGTARTEAHARLGDLWDGAERAKRRRRTAVAEDVPGLPFVKASIPRTVYKDNEEFYAAAAEYGRNARSTIRVTYVRQDPPSAITSEASAAYFQELLDWASTPGPRSLSRIIGVPDSGTRLDGPMLEWVREQAELTGRIRNYEVRVMRWASQGDNLNMALFDDDTVFFAVSGLVNRQQLSGCSLTDPDFHTLISAHFDQLWASLPRVTDFLAGLDP